MMQVTFGPEQNPFWHEHGQFSKDGRTILVDHEASKELVGKVIYVQPVLGPRDRMRVIEIQEGTRLILEEAPIPYPLLTY